MLLVGLRLVMSVLGVVWMVLGLLGGSFVSFFVLFLYVSLVSELSGMLFILSEGQT